MAKKEEGISEKAVKHTPGLWKVGGGRSINAKAFDGSWKWIADKIRGGSPEEAEANAALIAAAPELLKALERIRDGAEFCECEHDTKDCCANQHPVDAFCAFCIADISIRKARGEQL